MADQPKKSQYFNIDLDPTVNSADPIAQILTALKKERDLKVIQLSFDADPKKPTSSYQALYRYKTNLIPNAILKRIRDTEELIGGIIIPVRARQSALFARPRANRFDVGFAINFKPDMYTKYDDKQRQELTEKVIPKLKELLLNCGNNDGVLDRNKRTFGQFVMEIVEDLLTFGWFSVEVRRKEYTKEFHSFRAVDAGTIYFTTPQKGDSEEASNIRKRSKLLLEQMQGGKIDPERFLNDDYTWVQVVDDTILQVFTDKELLVWSNSPSTDINRSGYPTCPIERMLSAITTHINLTNHNKMYFLNGRAARNILIFKSPNVEENDISAIRAQMIAHINSSNAAWRMPVFGIDKNDEIDVMPLDGAGNRDMEFQYLADLNKRIIMAAFQMSPDEIAALSYLSRGTNSQALSESNNEWKLIAARDIGLRPLLLSLEDFFNERLLPQINPEWAKMFRIDLEGLDADSPEKEATRLQQDSALFLTMNDIMERVEKERVPIAGDFPLNAPFMQVVERYYTKGQILKAFDPEHFPEADKDPNMQYYIGDPVWMQMQGMKQQQDAAAQQQAAGGGAPPGGDQSGSQNPPPGGGGQVPSAGQSQPQDLDSAMGQLGDALGKSEKGMPGARKELLRQHKMAKKKVLDAFVKDQEEAINKIMNVVAGKTDDDEHDH